MIQEKLIAKRIKDRIRRYNDSRCIHVDIVYSFNVSYNSTTNSMTASTI